MGVVAGNGLGRTEKALANFCRKCPTLWVLFHQRRIIQKTCQQAVPCSIPCSLHIWWQEKAVTLQDSGSELIAPKVICRCQLLMLCQESLHLFWLLYTPSLVIVCLSQSPTVAQLHCLGLFFWCSQSDSVWTGTVWLPKTVGVVPQNQTSMLYGVGVGESLEKIMSCKIPSVPCEPASVRLMVSH